MKEQFIKNYDKIYEFILSKNKEDYICSVNIYRMIIKINYDILEGKLIETKQIIDNL